MDLLTSAPSQTFPLLCHHRQAPALHPGWLPQQPCSPAPCRAAAPAAIKHPGSSIWLRPGGADGEKLPVRACCCSAVVIHGRGGSLKHLYLYLSTGRTPEQAPGGGAAGCEQNLLRRHRLLAGWRRNPGRYQRLLLARPRVEGMTAEEMSQRTPHTSVRPRRLTLSGTPSVSDASGRC